MVRIDAFLSDMKRAFELTLSRFSLIDMGKFSSFEKVQNVSVDVD